MGVYKGYFSANVCPKAQGYEVLLITDEEPSDTDYPLPESVERVVILI